MKKLCFILFISLLASQLMAQLQVTQNLTPAQLVNQVLIGYGVTVSNVSYTGDLIAIGKFANGGTTNVGVYSGIIMTTGNATLAVGPNNSSSAGVSNAGNSDPQLASLVTPAIHDAAVLEFDFVPIADTVKFRYVFGSEEYPEYANYIYNDVFGFFISGPNPNGGTYNNYNMASLPGTTTPVSINNINNGTANAGPCINCSYYINNSNGYTIQYDGLMVVLEAWTVVTPCVTYHFKAAIGDAGDGALDSGVFLEAGSFSTNAVQVSTNFTIPGAIPKAIEGCNLAEIKVKIPKILPTNYVVLIDTMFGSATNGVDFPTIPNSIVVPAGQLNSSIFLTPTVDNVAEGQEDWNIVFITSPCTIDTVTIPIIDYTPIELINRPNDTMVCGDSLNLSVFPIYGIPPYTYSWSPPSTLSTPNQSTTSAAPTQHTAYVISVTDISGCPASLDTINISYYPAVYASFLPDVFQGCEQLLVTFDDMSGPNIAFWDWDFGDGNTSTIQNSSHTYSAGTYTVKLKVRSAVGCIEELTVPNIIHVWPQAVANFYLSPSVASIDNPTINFINTSTGATSWLWEFGEPGSASNTATTEHASHTYNEDGQYTVWLIATTDKGCNDTISYLANVIIDEIEVPNVITPNADGMNDKFVIKNIDKLESAHLRIYNRWGKLVFETDHYQNDWDGSNSPDGVYYWHLDYKTYFRESSEKGSVTIIGKDK